MNNNYDEIDNLFFEYFNNNKEVPNIINNGINTALSINKNKSNFTTLIKKIIITIISLLTVTGGIVFAKDIKTLFENIFGNYNNGITTAIENGYIEDIDMQYIESNDVSVKVNQITLDNYNLGVVLSIKLNEEIELNNISEIELKNIIITDENNKVLFAEYEDNKEFFNYCDSNNLDNNNFVAGYANSPANGRILNKENNTIIYSFYTTSDKFPISKELNIKFNTLELIKNTKYDEKIDSLVTDYFSVIKGSWEMSINLEEMKNERKSIEYIVTNINDSKTTINKAELSMSNMRLEIITSSDKIDFDKLQKREERTSINDLIPFHEYYIQTSEGKMFIETNSGSNGYETIGNKKIRFYTTFDYTYFDRTENIKVVLPTNKNQNLIIELKANNFESQ